LAWLVPDLTHQNPKDMAGTVSDWGTAYRPLGIYVPDGLYAVPARLHVI
jgi:hypothetical protein